MLSMLKKADVMRMVSIANSALTVADDSVDTTGVRDHGGVTVVHATFSTPLRHRTLALGADIVPLSAT